MLCCCMFQTVQRRKGGGSNLKKKKKKKNELKCKDVMVAPGAKQTSMSCESDRSITVIIH